MYTYNHINFTILSKFIRHLYCFIVIIALGDFNFLLAPQIHGESAIRVLL